MSAELPTRWAAGRAHALGLCQGSLQGSPWPGNLGAGWGWGCAGSIGSPLPVGAANHTLGSTEALLQSLTPHPFSQEKLRLRQVARLGLAQDVGFGGHTPPPAPWFLYSTVLQPTASPEVDWPETHLFLSSSFCLFLTIFFLKHDILIEMFTKH